MTCIRLTLSGILIFWAVVTTPDLAAQQQAPPQPERRQNPVESVRPTYTLAVGDQITIHAPDVEEISDKPYRIDTEGNLALPVLGTVPAAGSTVEQLETALVNRLRPLVRNPQATVSVVQYRSEPVFFQGALNSPGIYTLQGRRKLVEMLASIGGLQPNASKRIKITRHLEFGPIPLPTATIDRQNNISQVDISMNSLTENVNSPEDLVLQPFDVIRVEASEVVYVNGEVGKIGGIPLGERESLSITQAVAIAGGLGKDADPEKCRILRPVLDTSRRAEIPVNVKRIMEGKATDFPLMPNDVLYVPRSGGISKHIGTIALIAIPIIPTILVLALR